MIRCAADPEKTETAGRQSQGAILMRGLSVLLAWLAIQAFAGAACAAVAGDAAFWTSGRFLALTGLATAVGAMCLGFAVQEFRRENA